MLFGSNQTFWGAGSSWCERAAFFDVVLVSRIVMILVPSPLLFRLKTTRKTTFGTGDCHSVRWWGGYMHVARSMWDCTAWNSTTERCLLPCNFLEIYRRKATFLLDLASIYYCCTHVEYSGSFHKTMIPMVRPESVL
jgi:hypothetical protein